MAKKKKTATAPPIPALGFSPKTLVLGQSQLIRVYGEHLQLLGIRRFHDPESSTHNWSSATINDVKNHYIEFIARPSSRQAKAKRGTTEGDLTITVTFDDGTVDGLEESVTCEDVEYEEPLRFETPPANKPEGKASGRGKKSSRARSASARAAKQVRRKSSK